jgi:hypothetical protein
VALISQPTGTVEVAIGVEALSDYAGALFLGSEKLERVTLTFGARSMAWRASFMR